MALLQGSPTCRWGSWSVRQDGSRSKSAASLSCRNSETASSASTSMRGQLGIDFQGSTPPGRSASPRHCNRFVVRAASDGQGDAHIDSRGKAVIQSAIANALGSCLTETHLDKTVPGIGVRKEGKVRDTYDAGDYVVLVTTDRQSAFDRLLASVPFKGQVLNLTSKWWFETTRHITANAFVAAPHANVTVALKCSVFPVEFVVRGYITGSTSTSLWTVYNAGARSYCGNDFPEGLVKNQKLPQAVLTPTTKAKDHDEPVTPDQIVERGLMTRVEYDEVSRRALALFTHGQRVSSDRGLLLVDTKYEFGRSQSGEIMLLDEVHTPDSSRYWIAATYEERHAAGLEPDSIDKEFLRLWFQQHSDPYADADLPQAPPDLVRELAWRYIVLYEKITGLQFQLPKDQHLLHDNITSAVATFLSKQ